VSDRDHKQRPTLMGVDMAKQHAQQINTIQKDIPENHRDRMRLSDDGKTLFVTLAMPRYVDILIRKTETVNIDRAGIIPEQFGVTYDYGEGRRCRDGAETKDSDGNTLDAKVAAGAKALMDNAIAHCKVRIEIMFGKRAARATSSGVSTLVREIRKLFIQFAVKNLNDDTGKRYTAKTLPSALLTAKNAGAAAAEAKRIGIPPKKIAAHIKRATALATLIDADDDMSIDI